MTDPLSISASVAGLLSLVIQVADRTYQYASKAHSAPASVAALLRELQALKRVLVKLDDLTHDSHRWQAVPNEHSAVMSLLDIEGCTAEIEMIQRKLSSRLQAGGKMKAVQHMIWPFLEDKTVQMVKGIHGYVDIFHLALSMDSFTINKATLVEIQNLRCDIGLGSMQKSILQWLPPESQKAVHQSISSQRYDGTGQWFLNNTVFTRWLSRTDSVPVLWCRGIPGAGKTVLTSLVIDYTVSVDPDLAIVYYYINYKQGESQDAELILLSLLTQLLNKIPTLWMTVDRFYKECESLQRKASVDDAVDVLLDIDNPSSIVIAIDALDEASDSTRDTLLKQLGKLCEVGFRIFLTSRPAINIRQLRISTTVIDITAEKRDLEIFVRTRLQASENVQEILGDLATTIVSQMVNLIVSQAAGMFLLVVFQTDYVCNQISAKEMLEAATIMPSDPNSIYSRTLNQINMQAQPQARLANKVLRWLTFAVETFTSRELAEALAIEDQSKEMNPLQKPSTAILSKVCRGLVIINEKNDIIQLAHRTLQDYLTSLYGAEAGPIHSSICSACLTYLSFDVFRTGSCATPDAFRQRQAKCVFQRYATAHLGHHFILSSGKEILLERMYQFITCKALVQSYTQAQNHSPRVHFNSTPHFFAVEGTTELHIAAAIGESGLLELVLTRSPQLISETDNAGRTALALATERGCKNAVRSLLNAGSSIPCASPEGLLYCAARNGHDDIVEMLICHQDSDRQSSSGSQTSEQERQLLIAVMKGDKNAVRELLQLNIDPDGKDIDGGTSLQWAAWYGYDDILLTLLEHGADVNALDGTGRRALHEAAENGYLSTVEILLKRGAQVNVNDHWEWTPLHRATVLYGRWGVIDALLRHGANMDLRTSSGKNALDLACCHGQLDAIRMLLHHRGNSFPAHFDISTIEFERVTTATKTEINEILREYSLKTIKAEQKHGKVSTTGSFNLEDSGQSS